MPKDNRDPELIGVELQRARAQHGDHFPLSKVADSTHLDVPDFGTAENDAYRSRCNGHVKAASAFFGARAA